MSLRKTFGRVLPIAVLALSIFSCCLVEQNPNSTTTPPNGNGNGNGSGGGGGGGVTYPVIVGKDSSPKEIYPEQTITKTINVSSPNGGTLSYQWCTVDENDEIKQIPGETQKSYSYHVSKDTPLGTVFRFCCQVTNYVSGEEPVLIRIEYFYIKVVKRPVSAQTPRVTVTSNDGEPDFGTQCATKITLSVRATVSDGGTLSYKWDKEVTEVDDYGNVISTKWETVGDSNNSYSFITPNSMKWEQLKYRVTVTNTLVVEEDTYTATTVQEFVITEDNRPPMPVPEITFKMYSKAINEYLDIGHWDSPMVCDVKDIFDGEEFDLSASFTVATNDAESKLEWKWTNGDSKRPVEFTVDESDSNTTHYTGTGAFKPNYGYQIYLSVSVTNSDPAGNYRPSRGKKNFLIRAKKRPKITFNAGRGTFSDGEKEKTYIVPWDILHNPERDDCGNNKNIVPLKREDFCNWMKEIGMHKDVINTDDSTVKMTFDDVEFDDWYYSDSEKWSDMLLGVGISNNGGYKFTAKWVIDEELIDMVNKLFLVGFQRVLYRNPYSNYMKGLEAYRAEDTEDRLNIYYDIEVKDIKETGAYYTVKDKRQVELHFAANGKEEDTEKDNVGVTYVSVVLDAEGSGIADDKLEQFYDEQKHDCIEFLPLRNFDNAGKDDIAIWYNDAFDVDHSEHFLRYDFKRHEGYPVGYFAYKFEEGHSYRIKFCLYLDKMTKKYGVENFSWVDETAPSAKACMFVPCYALEEEPISSEKPLLSYKKKYNMPCAYQQSYSRKDSSVAKALPLFREPVWFEYASGNCGFSDYYVDPLNLYKPNLEYYVRIDLYKEVSQNLDNCIINVYEKGDYMSELLYSVNVGESPLPPVHNYYTNEDDERVFKFAPESWKENTQYTIEVLNTVEYVDNNGNKTSDTAKSYEFFKIRNEVEYTPFDESANILYTFDFENEKIYANIRQSTVSYNHYSDCLYMIKDPDQPDEPLQLQTMKLRAIGTDGTSLTETNDVSVVYNSFDGDTVITPKGVEPEGEHYTAEFRDKKAELWRYKSLGELTLSEEEKPAGELGYGLNLTPGQCYSFMLRADLTELPPRFEVLSMEE